MERILAGKSLEHALQALIDERAPQGKVSYLVTTLADDEDMRIVAARHESHIHTGASMVKVLIMEYLFHLSREGQLDLADSISLSKTPRVEGAGALQEISSKHSFTYLEYCRLMMVLSDNWATNILIQALGMENINAHAEKLGVSNVTINRMMMDIEAQQERRENTISALDLALLYQHIYNLRDESLYGSEMWNILGRQQYRDVIPFHWGDHVKFYHKTGSWDQVIHDGGILQTLRGDFCIIVLISDVPNDTATELGAAMGKTIKEFIEEALP